MNKFNLKLALLATLTLFAADSAAQSTLFNIPSTDVVAEKKTYLEFDFISHLEAHRNGGFQAYVPRVVYGVGKGVEVGVNAAFTDALAPNQPVELQPNVKYHFYQDDKTSVAAAVGGILYAPVANRAGTDTFGLIYATVSKKVSGAYGPRVTGGGYGVVGRADGTGTKGGAIAGYEQPLHRRVSFVADWLSGKNRFGYVTPGLGFTLPNCTRGTASGTKGVRTTRSLFTTG